MKQLVRHVFLLTILACSGATVFSQTSEYTLKAVALEKLALFISWPGNDLKNDHSSEFVIAVLGQNPFGDILEEAYKNRKIKDRKVRIVYARKIQQVNGCHILFIAKTGLDELHNILEYVKGKPVLTISDTEGFAEAGCLVNFYTFEDKLRFELNQKQLQNAGFKIDYRLLRASRVLNPVAE